MQFFCKKFNHPERFAPSFHVAGSKGKGSVSAFIASILDAAGYKTGLYTSPHILDFIERVSSAHGAFSDDVYNRAVNEIMSDVQKIHAKELPRERPITWFELVTLFAFLTFRQAKVDYSVFEVGLGGRLDSTNVIFPLCSVITPIELEHTEFLGNTLEKIAYEKGGIIKENTPVVIAHQKDEVKKVFQKIAKEKKAKLIFADEEIENLDFNLENILSCIKNNTEKLNKCLQNYTDFHKSDKFPLMSVSFSSKIFSRPIKTSIQLLGEFQAQNAALAALAVKTALPSITEDEIEKGLASTRLAARFELTKNPLSKNSLIVLDGAHTVNSVTFTMQTLHQVFEKKDDSQNKRILLFACARDKDAKDIAPLFKNEFDFVFLTKPGNVKQSDLQTLTHAFDEAKINYDMNEDFKMQIQKAIKKASDENAILLVTGSFYLIAEVKKMLLDVHSRHAF